MFGQIRKISLFILIGVGLFFFLKTTLIPIPLTRQTFNDFGWSFIATVDPIIKIDTTTSDGVCYKSLEFNTATFSPSIFFNTKANSIFAGSNGKPFDSDYQMKIHYQNGKGGFIWDPSWKIIKTQVSGIPATISSGKYQFGFLPTYFDRILVVSGNRMWELEIERLGGKWAETDVRKILASMTIDDSKLVNPICK